MNNAFCCANFTKWSNTLKQSVGQLLTNCLSVFDYFVGLALKGLKFLFVLKIFRFLCSLFWSCRKRA